MKKRSVLLALVVSMGLFVQFSFGMVSTSDQGVIKPIVTTSGTDLTGIGTLLGISGVTTGVEKGVEYIGGPNAVLTYAGIVASMLVFYKILSDKVAAVNKVLLEAAIDYTSNREALMLSKFPETIEERIDALLDQTLEDNGKFIPLFFTPQSKIFVLQNIEDFFVLRKQSEFYRNLNQLVHKICMEKINAIQLAEKNMDEETKKINEAIDNERKRYMNQYGISVATLKNISSEDLEVKIKYLQDAINYLVLEAVNNNTILDKEKNVRFSALISILAHLFYKQSEAKSLMFEGEKRTNKSMQIHSWKNNLEYKKPEFTKKARKRAAEEKRKSMAEQYGMKFLSQKKDIVGYEQSYWSRLRLAVKALFGYGNRE